MDGVVVVVGADAAGASVVAAVEYAVGLVGEGGSEEAGDEDCLSSSKRLDNLCLRPNRMEEPLQLAEFRLVTAAMEPLTCKDGHCVAASHRNDEFWGGWGRATKVVRSRIAATSVARAEVMVVVMVSMYVQVLILVLVLGFGGVDREGRGKHAGNRLCK